MIDTNLSKNRILDLILKRRDMIMYKEIVFVSCDPFSLQVVVVVGYKTIIYDKQQRPDNNK